MDYGEWKPYVPAAQRRAQAAREAAKRAKKGQAVSPVVIEGRIIARTFWGKAWCDNLERYSDYSNRLPRGRTYVRNGSVVDLQIVSGAATALVSGSELYDIEVKVNAVPKARWTAVCDDCAGAIDSLVELLQGRFSKGVMERICQEKTGLFPSPNEITFSCSCPDWASMCKHVAAVLYAIGARLDEKPDLLFALRNVNHQDLIVRAGSGLSGARKSPSDARVLETGDLSEIFGIEMAEGATLKPPRKRRSAPRALKALQAQQATIDSEIKEIQEELTALNAPRVPATKPAAPRQSKVKHGGASLTTVARKKLSDLMNKRWVEKRRGKRK
jgi:uncharacterized Zn finger protein